MSVQGRLTRSGLSLLEKRAIKAALRSATITKYVTADQAIPVSSTAHLVITDLQIPVEKNKVYRFDVNAYCTSVNAAAGAQISFTGSATANFITGTYLTEGLAIVLSDASTMSPANAPQMTVITAIADESDVTVGLHTQVLVIATGTYSPADDGFFKVSAGGAGSSANLSAFKKGSYLTLAEVSNSA